MRNTLPDRMTLTNERTPTSRNALSTITKVRLHMNSFAFPSANRELGGMKASVEKIGFTSIPEFLNSDINMEELGYEGKEDYLEKVDTTTISITEDVSWGDWLTAWSNAWFNIWLTERNTEEGIWGVDPPPRTRGWMC